MSLISEKPDVAVAVPVAVHPRTLTVNPHQVRIFCTKKVRTHTHNLEYCILYHSKVSIPAAYIQFV